MSVHLRFTPNRMIPATEATSAERRAAHFSLWPLIRFGPVLLFVLLINDIVNVEVPDVHFVSFIGAVVISHNLKLGTAAFNRFEYEDVILRVSAVAGVLFAIKIK